jgi:hypothetical protein
MKTFELVLKNEKEKQYRILALFIIIVNVLFFTWLAITDRELRIKAILTSIIVIAGILVPYYLKRLSAIGISIVFIVLFYLEIGYWQVAIVIAILSLMYVISARQLVVFVSDEHITYPSFPKKEIVWNDLNNLILKDGLLSIDFKNNKLAQAIVLNDKNNADVDEKEFNEFCQIHLAEKTV